MSEAVPVIHVTTTHEAEVLRPIPLTAANEAQRRTRTTLLFVRQAAVSERPILEEDFIIAKPALMPNPTTPSLISTAAPMPSVLDREGVIAERDRRPIVSRRPDLPVAEDKFVLLQQWEGVVQNVDEDEFTAVFRDLTNPSHPEEEGAFALQEVPADDLPLVAPGAVFYWSIGYRTHRTGQVDRVSTMRFRRFPAWSAGDLEKRDSQAEALMERFGR